MIKTNPFVLRLSKHENHFFSNLLAKRRQSIRVSFLLYISWRLT